MTTCAPIVLFIYNRPEHTGQVLASLAANPVAAQSDLVIYADGPKKAEHEAAVRAARAVAREARGFRSVRMVEREENLGLARSIMTGVAEVCAAAGRVIVVEDDLIVAPEFLGFLNEALERYADDERVMQASGYAFPVEGAPAPHLLPIISCWGWATWARAWQHFDPAMQAFERIAGDAALQSRFNLDGAYDYWGMACSQRAGEIDSWGIRWQMSLFAREGLVLYPPRSLVENAGVDASGTHGAGQAALQKPLQDQGAESHLAWPAVVEADQVRLERVKSLLGSQKPSLFEASFNRMVRAVLPKAGRAALKSIWRAQ